MVVSHLSSSCSREGEQGAEESAGLEVVSWEVAGGEDQSVAFVTILLVPHAFLSLSCLVTILQFCFKPAMEDSR